MRQVTFKGKHYPVRTFFDLRGDDFLHITVTMENGIGDAGEIVASVQSCLAVFVPSASKRMRSWPAKDVLDFMVLVFRQVGSDFEEGVHVIKRYAGAFDRMAKVIKERYGKRPE